MTANRMTRAALLTVDLGLGVLSSSPLPELARRGRALRRQARWDAARRLERFLPALLDACLDRVDLTALVVGRLDIDEVARQVDVAALVRRVDVDALLRRADIDALLRRVDVDALLSRVDVDAVARRLDLDAVVDRTDLIALARDVVDGIDLPQIIRDSTGSVASEGLDNVRTQSARADAALADTVDRLLRRSPRRGDPDLVGYGEQPAARPSVEGNGRV